MPTELTPATIVEPIAEELIAECHPHLKEANILYLFTNQKRKRCDKVVLGTAQKLSALQRYLSGANGATECDFIILFGRREWADLDDAQRRALVDHELCHCVRVKYDDDGDPVWGLRAHDVEEFREVIERHGLWKSDLKEFAPALQMKLPES